MFLKCVSPAQISISLITQQPTAYKKIPSKTQNSITFNAANTTIFTQPITSTAGCIAQQLKPAPHTQPSLTHAQHTNPDTANPKYAAY